MIQRQAAVELLYEHVGEDNQRAHALESEAVLRALARRLDADEDLWGLTGLLHDIDFATVGDDFSQHGMVGAKQLAGKLPAEALHAIQAHNADHTGVQPEAPLDWALRCGETITGQVSANARVRPKGMVGMKPKSLKKKMKDKSFAAAVRRDIIRECEKLGLELGEFLQLSIDAIAPIADQVGLA